MLFGASRSGLATGSTEPFCESHVGVCPDTLTHKNYEGQYVGHDEPSLLFYSGQAGSGNSNVWHLRIPRDAPLIEPSEVVIPATRESRTKEAVGEGGPLLSRRLTTPFTPSPRTHPVWAGLACSPCINAFNDRNSPCRDNVCMQAIGVAQVFDQVCRLCEGRRLKVRRAA